MTRTSQPERFRPNGGLSLRFHRKSLCIDAVRTVGAMNWIG